MKNYIWIFILVVFGFSSCGGSSSFDKLLDSAEIIAIENPDSALYLLGTIDPDELAADSLKAKYHLIKATIHDSEGHLMLSDSLIKFSADYYRDKDPYRAVSSATLSALYDYWVRGDRSAVAQLDSLANQANLPDSLAIIPLRTRAYWSTKLYDDAGNRSAIKRLISMEGDSARQALYNYWLYADYLFAGENDSALVILDELIGQAISSKSLTDQFSYEYEKVGVLEELGRYSESLDLSDKFSPGNSVEHYLHMWKSLALFNMGDREKAVRELEKADSLASMVSELERGYYDSFAYVLHSVFDFQNTGKFRMIRIALVNNRQRDNLLRTQALQKESEQNALLIENKRLSLKVRNERQMSVIIIIVLAGLLICGLSIWFALNRRRKTIEAEERAEVLQKMVEELKVPSSSSGQESLRRAMLQQLGIIKMVAETPTEQNREMLRKLSSIESDTGGALVNWRNVYEIIDNLYSGFYTRLHDRYGDVLSDKEEQIIVLMLAGFSTKEISVITSQTMATIYTRKSTIRRKLSVPEKEDIVGFIRREQAR